MYKEDTIAAIATPEGEGGIGIVRVSGPDAERIANRIFHRSRGKNGKLRSHTLYYGTVRAPENDVELDEVLLAIMRKPHSYTGEDVFEVHCHGGPLLVRQILELVLAEGARHAEAGEFTKRAFLNGRIDLAQAEAVVDLIRARTEKGLNLAANQVRGELSKWVGELRENLLDVLVQVEAAIDFPEEEIELLQRPDLGAKIAALREKIVTIIASYEWGRLYREGAKICVCGRPNVGKSSLLNALLGEQRVIVTPVPGTTRDVIEESINLGGLPAIVWDTAGIRETDDQVESMGVGLSLKYLEKADVALAVLDGSELLTSEDHYLLSAIKAKKSLVVLNKNDLPLKLDVSSLQEAIGAHGLVSISAMQGNGLEKLKTALRELVLGNQTEPPIVITNTRHKAALARTEESLRVVTGALNNGQPPEILAVGLQEAKDALEEIIGAVTSQEILERIFSSFCIGK
ncbi:MAG TPA: tRNA uridine-5-carboxymethylaminomethyl(34) synthesis GTPase MnmE [Candidatus Binatia bacterium]|nr:tRNA uridine-5-carboxymethylaminomethyl(34) synthesis GTPase MnmE [Candidatus Binatia bacterium]